jgi:hypothetical protein
MSTTFPTSTPWMGLLSWDQETDYFDHGQLAMNWETIDKHDHIQPNGGKPITTNALADNVITANKIANNAVTNNQLAPNSVATDNIQQAAITTALLAPGAVTNPVLGSNVVTMNNLNPTVIPLGTVMMWWCAVPGATPGGGWEIMDGRPWTSIANSLGLPSSSNTSIPNMIGKFPMGVDSLNVGTTGGIDSVDISHRHSVDVHNHTVPSHTHPITNDGNHMHLWQGGLHMGARANSLQIGLSVENVSNHKVFQNTNYSMYIQNLLSNPSWYHTTGGATYQINDSTADMDLAGTHAHSGKTQISTVLTSGNATPGTDTQLGNVSIIPSYVGFVFIMRCR